ncbi:hypothetical protein CTheo_5011 [Ceratobasidium theobromae]|uniref:Glycoside hydrolase 131 catalytic N-terminal domain-containing protein n=1 Tax=Ceratobasidium theobromae TaxID=1582974 RepID=A0A5N5QII2_9AGAM|nr:hypothetical protein CTheo_5011 [Ceratobasidium theobromae]
MVLARFGLLAFIATALATPVLYDGRAPLNYTSADIDGPKPPYVYVVKGSKPASEVGPQLYSSPTNSPQYVSFSSSPPPTPLWANKGQPIEQSISTKIDNSSVFVPGGNPANSQWGFRRTELIAQNNRTMLQSGKSVWHFSIMRDDTRPLNYSHEYQIVFIEPDDGSHVFGVRVGSPFTVPTADKLPVKTAHSLQVLDHATNVIYSTQFDRNTWHNFAVQVDWDARTLGVFASKGGSKLKKVSKLVENSSAKSGSAGQGDFHIGLIKLPIANPKDTAADQSDVVRHGLQDVPAPEGLYYSGVFVESTTGGVSAGFAATIPAF